MNDLSKNTSIQKLSPSLKIGIIGSGFMGTSIAKGIHESFPKIDITLSDIDKEKLKIIKNTLGINTSSDNVQTIKESNIIFLAVKPNIIPQVLEEISKSATKDKLIISIAAGVTIETLETDLQNSPVIRVMPNICAQIQEGALAYATGSKVTKAHGELCDKLLSALGLALKVEEKMLDAVTGLSGSGPAFIFMAIEALSDGGVLCGLPRDISNKLAAQTVLGSAKMYLADNCHAGALKDMVTSPGGTTICGVKALEDKSFRSALMDAVQKATEQSKKFSQK